MLLEMQCLQQTLYMSSLHIFYSFKRKLSTVSLVLEWLIVILFSFIETLLMTNAINVVQYFYYDKKILRNHQLGFIGQIENPSIWWCQLALNVMHMNMGLKMVDMNNIDLSIFSAGQFCCSFTFCPIIPEDFVYD